MTKVVFSVLCHEALDCLDDMIANIFCFSKEDTRIIVSINASIAQQMKHWPCPPGVIIHPKICEKQLYHSSILRAHIENYTWFSENDFYFIPWASNVMLIKPFKLDLLSSPVPFEKEKDYQGWHWPKFFANPLLVAHFKGVPFQKGQIEGRVYAPERAQKIFETLDLLLVPQNISQEATFEEILPATLERDQPVHVICKNFWDLADYRPLIPDVQEAVKCPTIFAVKRVFRDMNDPVRQFINKELYFSWSYSRPNRGSNMFSPREHCWDRAGCWP
jgi:hypothetical protein